MRTAVGNDNLGCSGYLPTKRQAEEGLVSRELVRESFSVGITGKGKRRVSRQKHREV